MYFFSIIIPIYNTEKFLTRCINSILDQNFDDYEIICINDCSPGNCKQIIETINSDKIKYIEQEKNSGTHKARITGIKIANSKYTLFLDSDDYYEKNTLSTLYKRLKDYSLDQLEFGYKTIPYNARNIFQYDKNKDSILEKVLRGDKPYINFSLCNKITKTEILKEAFSRMKDFYCIWFEDGYEQFHISSICKTFDSLKKYFLVLDETSGITTTNKELSAEKFLLRCKNTKEVIENLYQYTEKYNLQKYNKVIDDSIMVHEGHLIDTYLPIVKVDELPIAIKGIYEYFPENIVNECIHRIIQNIPLKSRLITAIKRKLKLIK